MIVLKQVMYGTTCPKCGGHLELKALGSSSPFWAHPGTIDERSCFHAAFATDEEISNARAWCIENNTQDLDNMQMLYRLKRTEASLRDVIAKLNSVQEQLAELDRRVLDEERINVKMRPHDCGRSTIRVDNDTRRRINPDRDTPPHWE